MERDLPRLRWCRFCGDAGFVGDLVKYGVRHYAHADCYLAAGKPLSDLSAFQLRKLPADALASRGLLAEREALINRELG